MTKLKLLSLFAMRCVIIATLSERKSCITLKLDTMPVKKKASAKKAAAKAKTPAAKKTAPKKAATLTTDPKPVKPRKSTLFVTYALRNEQPLYNEPGGKIVNRVLLGTYLSVTAKKKVEGETWLEAYTYGAPGWIREADTTKDRHLKVFFIDVGQGDGALVEVGNIKMLFDGGPRKDKNVMRYLNWQYGPLINKGLKVRIDHLFISHFDEDHYGGLIELINNTNFTFGSIYIAGLIKFKKKVFNTELGNKSAGLITTYVSNLKELKEHKENAQVLIGKFITAVENAKKEKRLINGIERLDASSGFIFEKENKVNGIPFNIEVLGPLLVEEEGHKGFHWFEDESHTVNGHSLVLKMNYGTRTFMFGGDLNTDAEEKLLEYYKDELDIFKVDVAKSCHHGASEFTEDFMSALSPFATVISSGDNNTYAHPRADAVGCAGKYSSGKRPLVFSTELARSIQLATQKIQYGMINLRCDGKDIYLAQKKEAKDPDDMWDSYGPL